MEVIKTLIDSSLIIGAITYLAKKLIEMFFSSKTEEFKNNLEKENIKLRIRYEKLHGERAEVIKEFYKRISKTFSSFQTLMQPIQLAGELSQEDKAEVAVKKANDMIDYFEENRIFFEKNLADDIGELLKTFRLSWAEFSTSMELRKTGIKYHQEWHKAWKILSEETPIIKHKIEDEFRNIIGID